MRFWNLLFEEPSIALYLSAEYNCRYQISVLNDEIFSVRRDRHGRQGEALSRQDEHWE